MSDRLSKGIQYEIDKINSHLPVKILSLRNLLQLDKPGVKLRDGFFLEFSQKELEYIKSVIPSQYWGHVRLPILITRRRDLGGGAYMVGGSEQNLYIVLSAFNELPRYDLWRINGEKDYIIYKHHLPKIRKKLETSTVIAFS